MGTVAGVLSLPLAMGKAESVPTDLNQASKTAGLYCGNRYGLPTTARQLIWINLDDGQIESVAETKEILGNLVGVPDRLISQTAEDVKLFGAEEKYEEAER